MRGAWVCALLAALLTAHTARGEERLEVRWQAPANCPQDLSFLLQVEAFLGRQLEQSVPRALTVDARVAGDEAQGYAAALSFKDAQGTTERELTHPDCSKLTEAAALLVALVIDPERVKAVQQGSAPSQPETVEPAPVAAAPVPPAKEAPPAPVPFEGPSVPRRDSAASRRAA